MQGRFTVALALLLLSLAAMAQATPTVSLPGITGRTVGSTVNVAANITVPTGESIGGSVIQIQYDPAVVTITSDDDVTKGSRISASTFNLVVNRAPALTSTTPPTTAGVRTVVFGSTSLGAGSGGLLNIKFLVVGLGSTPLKITRCEVNDPPESCTVVDGSIAATVCNSTVEGPFGSPSCTDSVDNDCDGAVDAQDPDCQAPGLDALIPGGGSIKTDCMAEWQLENVTLVTKKGIPLKKQSCTDGAACDADGAVDGTCTFQVSACLNVPDARLTDSQGAPACQPTDVAQIDVVNIPDPLPLVTQLTNLGGQVRVFCTNRGAKKGNLCQRDADCDTTPGKSDGKCKGVFSAFTSPLVDQTCTLLPVSIDVPQGAAITLKTNTLSSPQNQRKKDTDSLQLICLPPA